MSGLADLLAGARPAGIYMWDGPFPVEEVRHAVELAGWRFAHLDAASTGSRQQFLTWIGEVFSFPDHYGHNFDALADLLAEVRAEDQEGTVLLWDGWGGFARADRRAFGVALAVLETRVAEEQADPFVVLLRGEGPALGVPALE